MNFLQRTLALSRRRKARRSGQRDTRARPLVRCLEIRALLSSYIVTDLGNLGGGGDSAAYAINNAGEVVGWAPTATGVDHAFLYTGGAMTDLGTLGGNNSYAYGINDAGVVVGSSRTATGAEHAFLYTGGAMTDLGVLGGKYSYARAINDAGEVVGWSNTASVYENHAFVYTGGAMTDLGTFGGNDSGAEGINDAGQVVGWAQTATGLSRAFLYTGGAMVDLGFGENLSRAYGINNAGEVVGFAATETGAEHAFLYTGGAMTDLGTFGGEYSYADAINDAGEVVGDAQTAAGEAHAFLYTNGLMQDLNSLIPADSGWVIDWARGINDKGQIAAHGWDVDGAAHALLLTPSDQAGPTATLVGPSDGFHGVAGQSRTFAIGASDNPDEAAAGFTYLVDWGDGTPGNPDTQTISATPNNGSGLTISHVFSATGTYTVTLTATAEDGDVSQPASLPITIVATEQQGTTRAVGAGADTAYVFTPGAKTGTVMITAGSNVLGTFTTAQVLVYGSGTATVNGTSAGDVITINSTAVSVRGVSVSGPNLTGWTVNGLGGGNIFVINASGLHAVLSGGPNNDRFAIADGLAFDGSIVGGGGTDTIVETKSLPHLNSSWVINGPNTGTVNGAPFSGIASLTGGWDNDTFSFLPGGSISGKITGGLGGGIDTLDYSGYVSAVTVNLATATATAVGSFSGIKRLVGSTATNTLDGPNTYTSGWKLTGPSSGTVRMVAFSSFENLFGGALHDTFFVSPGVTFNGSIHGGRGAATLVGLSTANTAMAWVITGSDTGTLNGTPFSGISNLKGGAGNDTFRMLAGASLGGQITGGGGSDTLDYSSFGDPVTVNLATSTATAMGSLRGIKNLVGSTDTNTLEGANAAHTWKLSGATSGTVGQVSFSGFEDLVGGTEADTFTIPAGVTFAGSLAGGGGTDKLVGQSASGTTMAWVINGPNSGTFNGTPFSGISNLTGGWGDDVFRFLADGSVSGLVNGGTGANWLDYSALLTGVTVNLSSRAWNGVPIGSATAIAGGVSGVKNIRGGAGDDTLIGGGGNILIGGGGNDTLVNNSLGKSGTNRSLLIGGSDADSITAGAAGDILIGGGTTYDGSNAALQAILAEWQSKDSYSARFTTLQAGVGSGGYQLVWGGTVFDDSAPDTLSGGIGYDWYFAHLGNGVVDTINGLNTPGHEHVDNTL